MSAPEGRALFARPGARYAAAVAGRRTSSGKRSGVDELVDALLARGGDWGDPVGDELLQRALEHKSWLVAATAAQIVGERQLSGHEERLIRVWERFSAGGAKDPGCRAKEAALTALDQLEGFDPDPFIEGVHCHQLEPVMGGRVDTAGGVRQRAVYALLRMVHSDALLHAAVALADADPHVRAGVARGLGHYAGRAGAPLLLFLLEAGDDDAVVIADGMMALLAAAPDFGLSFAVRWLTDGERQRREAAALALGQSEREDAVQRLVDGVTWSRPRPSAVHPGSRSVSPIHSR